MQVILLVVDCLRADHLGCYGYKRTTSPNIDKEASRGMLFENMRSCYASTNPSVLTILSGKDHNIRNQKTPIPDIKLLPEVLKVLSYGVTGNGCINQTLGFNRGFKRFSDVRTNCAGVMSDFLNCPEEDSFFGFMFFVDTHTPYSGDMYGWLFKRDKYYEKKELPITKNYWEKGHIPVWAINGGNTDAGHHIAMYDGAIKSVDYRIGLLRQFYPDAVFIITGDHGEAMGEEDYWFTHDIRNADIDCLYEVPLIISGGNIKQKVAKEPTTHKDLFPLITGLFQYAEKPKEIDNDLVKERLRSLGYLS